MPDRVSGSADGAVATDGGPRAEAVAEARRRFARPELAPLWAALRERLETATGPVSRVRVGPLTPAQRTAIADLLGLARLPGEHLHVSVPRLDRTLLDSPAGLDARGVVEALGGPLVDRAGRRRAERQARADLWAWLACHPQVREQPALEAWVATVRAGGLVEESVPATRRWLEQALAVLRALPADGSPLPSFANDVLGDPHALDDGTRLGAAVLRAVAALRDQPPPVGAEQRRLLWAEVGVACDALSTTVLTLGLGPAGDGPLAATLRRWAEVGQAAVVTLAQLRADPLTVVPHRTVWAVENPSVVAEAQARFGSRSPPVVCTAGWPNSAAVEILCQLSRAGARLRYHGDLDGEGLRIAAYVVDRTGAIPWAMSAREYLSMVHRDGPPVGRVTDVPWDARLAPALRARGAAVPQEDVCPRLLDAVAATADPPVP